MRITGGSHRGRILTSPSDDRIRPTADKTRLAVFNMLQARQGIVDTTVIDAFCGTGALGLEALSRGAKQAILFDADAASLALARKNTQDLRLDHQTTCLLQDATKLPRRLEKLAPASLVFLDPPYRQNMVIPALISLQAGDWLAHKALCVIETEKEYTPQIPSGFRIIQQKSYGQSTIYLVMFDA